MKKSSFSRIFAAIVFILYSIWILVRTPFYNLIMLITDGSSYWLEDLFRMNFLQFVWLASFILLAILLIGKAKKGLLIIPVAMSVLPNFIWFIQNIRYSIMYAIIDFIYLVALILLILLIVTRKHTKPLFFAPGALMILYEIAYFVTMAFDWFKWGIFGSDIGYIIYEIIAVITGLVCTIGYILLGKYIVSAEYDDTAKDIFVQDVATQQPEENINPEPDAPAPQEEPDPAVQEPVRNISEELQQYKDLLAQGLITEEDYNDKKRQLLGL